MSSVLKEVAAILAEQPRLPCHVEVSPEDNGGPMVITVTLVPPIGLLATGLRHELEYLAGLDQVREFAERYDIPAEQLEAVLNRGKQ